MARLNEPTMPEDELESLRKKFLRLNREIVRSNSTQSLKIRSLENECARLMSENLELRSQIIRLQTELEGSQAKIIADHALQIKEKMEAQLVEWGTMLASLGHEPIPMNRSPRAAKKPRISRASAGRPGASDWRRRETMSSMQELEAAALQEGRLPPVWENKPYPRETLNQDEILALRSEAEESTESPEIGPPPVSRFIHEESVQLDLATLTNLLKPAPCESESSRIGDVATKVILKPKLTVITTDSDDTAAERHTEVQTESTTEAIEDAGAPESPAASLAAKGGLKRKAREEDEREKEIMARTQLLSNLTSKPQLSTRVGRKERPIARPMKELPLKRIDGHQKTSLGPPRKPLGNKNSNEVLGSPKKNSKVAGNKQKSSSEDEGLPSDNRKHKKDKAPAQIEAPAPSSPVFVTQVEADPEIVSVELNLAVPSSPGPTPPRQGVGDTPPPVDISSNGETTRGSRRARAAVSYAEPNLRDKMRRPNTKHLFDAVAGEGKNIRRTSQYQRDETISNPSSVAKPGSPSTSSRKGSSYEEKQPNDASHDADILASPLGQKSTRIALAELPATVTTGRRGKDSTPAAAVTAAQDDSEPDTSISKTCTNGLDASQAEVDKASPDLDVYDFPQSSPTSSPKDSSPEERGKKAAKGSRQSLRRLSSVPNDDLQQGEKTATHVERASSRHASSRKRASMAATTRKSTACEEGPTAGDNTAEGADRVKRERASNSRRRSMMI
ncbi:hypothetical protein F5Y17DRAFT_161561 [Xylariaceae sp. FL0594]|nr:hypothetical protein F5Y17DRAFT_161561 [Xylariaceae sp. FL0594]